jgi:hypothetical protein
MNSPRDACEQEWLRKYHTNPLKKLLCRLFGHRWSSSGWSSRILSGDDRIPENVIRMYRHCHRCGNIEHLDETHTQFVYRFKQGNRVKYYDDFVEGR